jgi:diadenosine tetraphosphate (Ap4A) HIT family hydrolase
MNTTCPYCPVSDHDTQIIFDRQLVLYMESEKHQGSLRYSGVIIPKQHRETLFDMTAAEFTASFELLSEVKAWMDEKYHPDGYNVGWNCFPVGGQVVMHAHMHVIPRFGREPLAGKGIRTYLKSESNRW